MSSEMTMFLEDTSMVALVLFGIWGVFNKSKLIAWEKRHGIDFTSDVYAIGRAFKKLFFSLAILILCLLSFVFSKITNVIGWIFAERRLVYVAPKGGLTIGTYKWVRR